MLKALKLLDVNFWFMKSVHVFILFCFLFLLSSFTKYTTSPCDCEIKYYKQKRGIIPSITAFLKDSATGKPLAGGALDINGVITFADEQGKVCVKVSSYSRSRNLRKYKVAAKSIFYWACTKKITVREKDSVVCVFTMRWKKEVLY